MSPFPSTQYCNQFSSLHIVRCCNLSDELRRRKYNTHLGIWGHTLRDNKAFLNYFDIIIIPLALGPLVNSTQYLDKISSHMNNNTAYISVPATSPSGAVVNYLLPSAMNNIDSKFIPFCSPPPGSTFPKGQIIVKCNATDKPDNKTAIATFRVRVTAEPCVNFNTYTNSNS